MQNNCKVILKINGGVEVLLHAFLTSALDGDVGLRIGRFNLRKAIPVSILLEVERAPGPVWML